MQRQIKVKHDTEAVTEAIIDENDMKFFWRVTPWPDDYRELYTLRSDLEIPEHLIRLVGINTEQKTDCPACTQKRIHTGDDWNRYHPNAGTGYSKT